jgi:sec-independent protein translocase protein TatA
MGGMSLLHWIIILFIVMLVMGPSRLPTLGRSLGEAIRGFKKGLEGDEIDVSNAQRRENLNSGNNNGQQQNQNSGNTPKTDA